MKFLPILLILPVACLSCERMVSRQEWHARNPINESFKCLAGQSRHVIIHHTKIPDICHTVDLCKKNMNSMQRYHQETRKWQDIGYNFCIGGDSQIYEGRGWGVVGYPSRGYEASSTHICFIGDYEEVLPSPSMIAAAQKLIQCGIEMGYIVKNPKVLAIGEVIPTYSPGKKLWQYVKDTRLGYPTKLARFNDFFEY